MKRPAPTLPYRAPRPSAVQVIADELRMTALQAAEGDFLGSEESLSAHFQVSAPTLRQAARMLEHEEVVEVKRGKHGGYFAQRPDIDTVSRIAAIYLRGNLDSFDQVHAMLRALMPLWVDLLLASDRLDEIRPYAEADPAPPPHAEFVARIDAFSILLRELSASPPLEMVLAIFYQTGDIVPRRAGEPKAGMAETWRAHRDYAQALLARDREGAIAAGLAQLALIHQGIQQDLDAERETVRR